MDGNEVYRLLIEFNKIPSSIVEGDVLQIYQINEEYLLKIIEQQETFKRKDKINALI